MSVSVAQNSERIEQLRASANSGNSAADRKRVDALFRHVEGLKTDLAAMDRTERTGTCPETEEGRSSELSGVSIFHPLLAVLNTFWPMKGECLLVGVMS